MTAQTSENYLYGGTFDSAACTNTASFNGGNPTSFTPEAGKTYYIWEVDKEYLMPKHMSIWEHNSRGNLDVIGFYLATAIDREYYDEAGFVLDGETVIANQISQKRSDGSTTAYVSSGRAVVYSQMVINRKDGTKGEYTVKDVFGKDTGYIACYGVDKESKWNDAGDTVEFIPYWITLDGVKVTNSVKRTCEYRGEGSNAENKSIAALKNEEVAPIISYVGASNAAPLSVLSAYVADGSPINLTTPTEPEQPAEPEQPTEPEQPAEPEQPTEPGQPSDEITVTVHDAGESYTVTVAKGDLRGKIAYSGESGKLFAGWYLDSGFRTVTDLANITEDAEIYAKYVSDAYLQMKYIENGFFRSHSVYLIAAVEGRDFMETGFVINGESVAANGGSRRVPYSAAYLFGRSVGRNARLIVTEYSLNGIEDGAELVVTPYWVTADGSTVYGTQRCLTMGWYGLEG